MIKARTQPAVDHTGSLVFVGVGKKTVDTQQIKAHFKSLGIGTDWKLFDSIADVRKRDRALLSQDHR